MKVCQWSVLVAVKCGWFPSVDSIKPGRSYVAPGDGGMVDGGRAVTGDEVVHRDGLVAGGGGSDSVKRSRDYRTSSRSNVTTSAATTAMWTSTTMTTLMTCMVMMLIAGRTS